MISNRDKGLPPKSIAPRPSVNVQPQYVVAQPTKSIGIGIVLTLLFGPIGLFYASISGGIIMLIIGGILNFFGLLLMGFGVLFTWPLTCLVCAIWSYFSISRYNAALIRESKIP